jgi:hypothetical protein
MWQPPTDDEVFVVELPGESWDVAVNAANPNEGGQTVMSAAVVATLLGLLIVIMAVGTPYWLTHRHMRPQHDPRETQAYAQATDRSAEKIAAGAPSPGFDGGSRAGREWRAAHAGLDPETGERAPQTGKPGWPDGTG